MYVRHPVWIQRVRRPGAEAFAILFALESLARALLATVIPLQIFALLGNAWSVSLVFFFVSLVSLCGTFAVPWLVRKSARRSSTAAAWYCSESLRCCSSWTGSLFR